MPKGTMGGIGHAEVDARADEASKHRRNLDTEKPVAVGEGSSGQQGRLGVLAAVQALHPEKVSPLRQPVAPLSRQLPPLPQPMVDGDVDDDGEELEQVAPLPQPVAPLPWESPPLPEPVVVSDDNEEDVAPLAPQPEQVAPLPQPVAPLPRVLPPLPEPVVVGDIDEKDVLYDDVDSDEDVQRIYRRRKTRELENGVHEKRVRPRFTKSGGYGCLFCNKVMKGGRKSVIQHALGTSLGSLRFGHAFRVKHSAYAEYLSRLYGGAHPRS